MVAKRMAEGGSGELAPRYVGGDPALDLVNTVDWTDSGLRRERLGDYARLTRWAEGAGVLSSGAGRRLRRMAAADPAGAGAALGRARRLRDVLKARFTSVATHPDGKASGAAAFEPILADALGRVRLERRGRSRRHEWVFPAATSTLDGFLDVVVWSGAQLLASEEAESIRVCAGPDCGWVFVDRSRNGLRRWCEMETCGTQAKTRRRRKSARRTAGSG